MEDEKTLRIRATDKIAYLAYRKPNTSITYDKEMGQTVYVVPDTPEIRDLLNEFQENANVPCKTYSDLIKSYRAQLMAAKRSFGNGEEG